MRKLLFLFGLSLLILTGCGKKDDTSAGTTKTTEVTSAKTEVVTPAFKKTTGNTNLDLQKDIMAQLTRTVNNPNLIGPANIKKGIYNPAIARKYSKDTAIVGIPEPPTGNFNPLYSTSLYDAPMCDLVFCSLLRTNRSGQFGPSAAMAMPEISKNHKVYTYKLRKDIKFSDGSPLTAKDVVFTFEAVADPSYDGRMGSYAENLVGYKEFNAGKADSLKGIKALDDYTVQFTFQKALVNNLDYSGSLLILSSKYYAYKRGDLAPMKDKMRQPMGAGPYKVKNFEPRQYAQMEVNEYYFGKKPAIENIILKYVSSKVAVQALIKGDIDVLPGQAKPEIILEANKCGYINRIQYLQHGYRYICINNSDPILKDKTVRQALAYGLNKNAFLQLYYKGLAMPLDIPCSVTWWMYTKDFDKKIKRYNYNPTKAKELLEKDGWKLAKDGYRYKNGQKLEVVWACTTDSQANELLMPILQQDWKNLGVDVKIKRLDFNSLLDMLKIERKGFSIATLGSAEGTLPDPYFSWHSSGDKIGGYNNAQLNNQENDKLIEKMMTDFDNDQYAKDWQAWVLFMNEQQPIITLGSTIYTDLFNDRIKDFTPTPLYRYYMALAEARIDNGK